MLHEFRVVSRSKIEKADGVKYKVKLKSSEGHTLMLVAPTSEIFVGFSIGETVPVDIRKEVQKTLEA